MELTEADIQVLCLKLGQEQLQRIVLERRVRELEARVQEMSGPSASSGQGLRLEMTREEE